MVAQHPEPAIPAAIHGGNDALSSQQQGVSSDGPNPALAQERLAEELLRKGKHDEAEAIYRRLIIDNTRSIAVYANSAIICRLHGRTQEAIELLSKAIQLNPSVPQIHFNLGNALVETGRVDESIESFQRALQLKLDFPEALFNLGNAHLKQSNHEQAIAAYNKALCIRPRFPEALLNLGNALKEQKLLDPAILAYERALELQPDDPQTLFKLGVAFKDKGSVEAAISLFEKAVTFKANFPEALTCLGDMHRDQGKRALAESYYKKSISADPNFALAHFNLGVLRMGIGELDQAIAGFKRAISLKDNFYPAQLNLSLALLMNGAYREGWLEYEWRWAQVEPAVFSNRHAQWSPLDPGKNLLITCEQGIGDQIMFCSMLREVLEHVSSATVTVDHRLIPLLNRSFHPHSAAKLTFLDKTFPKSDIEFDAWIPLGSLGKHFRNSLDDFKVAQASYLSADLDQCRRLKRSLCKDDELLCGISWKSLSDRNGPSKSMALAALVEAVAQDGIRLVTLQYGDVASELRDVMEGSGIDLINLHEIDNTNDLDGLASLIMACDLVISTSNSTAHLAGALGKEAWVLLQQIPDWRWGLQGESSLWYPSLRLFRQATSGQWDDVLAQVSQELSSLIQATST